MMKYTGQHTRIHASKLQHWLRKPHDGGRGESMTFVRFCFCASKTSLISHKKGLCMRRGQHIILYNYLFTCFLYTSPANNDQTAVQFFPGLFLQHIVIDTPVLLVRYPDNTLLFLNDQL